MVARGAKTDDDIQFLMTRRRNTYAFGDFVQAKYLVPNSHTATLANLAHLFNYMTLDEKKAIKTNNFSFVWYMYWHTNPESTPAGVSEKYKFCEAKKHFDRLIATDNGATIANLINQSTNSVSCIDMFEFPKGRKGQNESARVAAERELVEETNFNRDFFTVYDDIEPYAYSFVGKDDKQNYVTNYYVGEILVPRHHAHVSIQQWRQVMEVSEIRLFNMRVIRELFPHYEKICRYAIMNYRRVQERFIDVDLTIPQSM